MATTGSAEDLHRAWPDLARLPAGGGAEVVWARASRAARLVAPEALRALLACRGFATLDQHAARIAAQVGGAPAVIRADLAELSRAGLLVSAADLLRRIEDTRLPDPRARVAALGIPTRERVPELRGALESYAGNALAHGRRLELVVADDAPDARARAETRAAVVEIATRLGVSIAYIGLEEKARYAALLADHAGVPRPLAEFALLNPERCGYTLGGNQNALVFHGAGEPMIHVDDDTRCRLAPAPGRLPGLALTSRGDPTELWFPGPGVPDLPDRVVVDRDYAALHEAVLGRRVTACAAEARRQALDLDGASGALFMALEDNGGRVACTSTGAAGDSGTGSMWHYLLLGDSSRARLLASEGLYRHAFTGRRVVRAAPRVALSDGGFFMSMSIGLDLRSLVPPFFPVQRNADGLFAVILRAAWRGATIGHLPWVVAHAPAGPRSSPFDGFFADLGRTPSVDLLCLLVSSCRLEADPTDPARSLRVLGEMLERWGRLPLADFEEIVRVQAVCARSQDLAMLEAALDRHGRAPAFWARDVERAAAALRAALPRRGLGHPAELMERFGDEAGRAVFQRLVQSFGQLLQVWPELFAAAVDLRRRGVRPGVVVGSLP
jgi:hypothetical protein